MAGGCETTDGRWMADWLDAVRDGRATMSQRSRASIDARGGVADLVEAARRRGLHLVELQDEKGRLLVVASLHPFRTLC